MNRWRTLMLAFWLGWQLETNWARPWVFVVYVFVKPICASLVLACMFYAARAAVPGRVPAEFLPFVYVSNAVYSLVGLVMFGLSYAVIRDREHYRMLKYVYISPGDFRFYVAGRGLARVVEGAVGALANVTVGLVLFAELRQEVTVQPGWLTLFGLLGIGVLWAGGQILAGICLNLSRQGMFLSEGVAGVVYLLSGVLYPLSILPGWLQGLAVVLPTTWWVEGMRRALLGPLPEALQGPLSHYSTAAVAGYLALTTLLLLAGADWVWRYGVRRAWQRGLLEENAGV
ncbi:MAG: ABC transporter permease [Gemmataceae bacterium]|nr:ABC transporter permease [Gemmataceae bacterium]MCS7270686.1 ABC transporter permease [Gemmataceae bacterium]MDW8244673.1 ABC transporter permease [Thermogemmata sp.]